MTHGIELIAAERDRQITAEGWSAAHDDGHTEGELVKAASCYLAQADGSSFAEIGWPWSDGWNPSEDDTRNLAKAGALIAAEIDRLARLAGDPLEGWTEEPPAEPGNYWFYGDESYGSMGGHYEGTIPPEARLHYVKVSQISNGLLAVTSGRFMSLRKFDAEKRREGHIGVWRPVLHPAIPTFDPFRIKS